MITCTGTIEKIAGKTVNLEYEYAQLNPCSDEATAGASVQDCVDTFGIVEVAKFLNQKLKTDTRNKVAAGQTERDGGSGIRAFSTFAKSVSADENVAAILRVELEQAQERAREKIAAMQAKHDA